MGSALFRLLGDDARLRVLRLLDAERLNVSELTGILGIAQSGVSRHLGLLKEAGLVERGPRGRLLLLPHRPGGTRRAERLRTGVAAARGAVRTRRPALPQAARTMRAWPKCAGCVRRTSTRMRGRTRTSASSCPAAAGPPGHGRSGISCRRCASRISDAARDT